MVLEVKNGNEWVKIPYLSVDTNNTVFEAPTTGQQYARQDGGWTVITIPTIDVTKAYVDTALFTKADSISTYTKAEVDSKISSVYRVKGSVASYSALPTSNVNIGDVYNITDTGANYVALTTTPTWDKLSETVDLSGYLTITNAIATYQPKGDYVTNAVLTAKGYATTTSVNNTFANYSTTTQMNTAISTATSTKLNTSAYTASDVLAKLVTVDGASSGIDADLLDGKHGSVYALKTDLVTVDTALSSTSTNPIANNAVNTALNSKVSTVSGKGLSTNDYTTAEKTKLSGIATGAQVNTVTSVAGRTGAVILTKSDVSLANVDNTSDINKPISTATQTALNSKEASFTKNTAFNKNFGTTSSTVCQGNDSRLSNSRPASDVYSWAKASVKPTYTASEVGAISGTGITAIVSLTQAEYDAITTKSSTTFYIIQ